MQLAIVLLAVYLFIAYIFTNLVSRSSWKENGFNLINVLFCSALIFFYSKEPTQWVTVLIYLFIIVLSYLALLYSISDKKWYYSALTLPLLPLVFVKLTYTLVPVGLSYLTLRLSYLVYEIHTGKAQKPSIARYFGFALFPLTFFIGPISPYQTYDQSLLSPSPKATPILRSCTRLFIGSIKCFLLMNFFKRTSFEGAWFYGHPNNISNLFILCVSSYLQLYFSFSGACDMIIGAAGILEIRVKENFSDPLLARNIREFWERFHITLTDYMRDIVFTPGVIWMGRQFGTRWLSASTSLMLLITFSLVGIWHGKGLNFLILGILHGIAMILFYWFSLFWKKMPLKVRETSNTLLFRVVSMILTFSYVSFTFIFFENEWEKIREIFSTLQW